MQLDRRRLVALGLGSTGIGAANLAEAHAQGRARSAGAASATDSAIVIGPEGGRDDTARLQQAIDRSATERRSVKLTAGRYLVRGVKLREGSHVIGAGGGSVLLSSTGAACLIVEGVADATVERLTLRGGPSLDQSARGLVEVRGARNVALRELVVDASPTNGIMIERSSGVVTGCRVTNAAKAGILSLDAEGGVELTHNHLLGHGNNGILVWRSAAGEDGSMVAFNRIERIGARDGGTGQNGNGINVFRAGSVVVTSNRISDCAFSAVRANSASNVQIIANNISRMGEVAIYAEFAFEGAVISGNLVDGAATGISVTNFDHGGRLAVVQGNLVRNLALHRGPSDPGGYGISVEADAAVSGNTIEGAPTAGLAIGWGRYCRDVSATGNVIRKCALGIAVTGTEGAGAVLIANNMISGAIRGAIRAMDHGTPIGQDLVLSAPPRGRISAHGNVSA